MNEKPTESSSSSLPQTTRSDNSTSYKKSSSQGVGSTHTVDFELNVATLANLSAFPQILKYLSLRDIAALRVCDRALSACIVKQHAWFRHVHTVWINNAPTFKYKLNRFISHFDHEPITSMRVMIWVIFGGCAVTILSLFFILWLFIISKCIKYKRLTVVFGTLFVLLFPGIQFNGKLEQISIPPYANPDGLIAMQEDQDSKNLLRETGGPWKPFNIKYNLVYLFSGGFIFPILIMGMAILQVVTIIGSLNFMHNLRLARAFSWPFGFDFRKRELVMPPADPRMDKEILDQLRSFNCKMV